MRKGVVIHPEELSLSWIERAEKYRIDVIGLHPVGGADTVASLHRLVEHLQTAEFRSLIDLAKSKGIAIEYEIHAAGWLLDRNLFKEHPEYFYETEDGNRTNEANFCVSNEEAMTIAVENAVKLAKLLYGSEPYYYFWMDDIRKGKCMCEKCNNLSTADQQLIFVNRVATRLREEIPNAKVSYLAYYDALEVPTCEKAAEGVFLEYAPIVKYVLREDADYVKKEKDQIEPLLSFFGKEDSKVLEYWLDNSLFSDYKKPPRFLQPDRDAINRDIKEYCEVGFEFITNFACYLGLDYEEIHGEPNIAPYCEAF